MCGTTNEEQQLIEQVRILKEAVNILAINIGACACNQSKDSCGHLFDEYSDDCVDCWKNLALKKAVGIVNEK